MMGIALGCFIGLFAFGHQYLGWHDPHGQVQLGLFKTNKGSSHAQVYFFAGHGFKTNRLCIHHICVEHMDHHAIDKLVSSP